LPVENSRQASRRFSGDIISPNVTFNCLLQCLLTIPPPATNLPILHKLVETYRFWHETAPRLPKAARYTLGSKIDLLLLEIIESVLGAAGNPADEKADCLAKASGRLDLLKFLLKMAWEIKAIDSSRFLRLSENLAEIGRMIGGWLKKTRPQQ